MTTEEKEILNSLSITQKMAIIDNWISYPKHRELYKTRITNNSTYEDLAAQYGYSVNNVNNIIRKCNNVIIQHYGETQDIPFQFIIRINKDGYVQMSSYH